MKDLAIYGAGGFGREVFCYLRKMNQSETKWNFIGFFDDGKEKGTKNEYGVILGGLEELNNYGKEIDVVMAIGSSSILERITSSIINPRVNFPNIITESNVISDPDSLHMGHGNIIIGPCTFTCNINLGDFNVMNGKVSVGHDVTIGSYNVFMPSAYVSGETTIGNGCFFGVNSVILQQIKISNNVRLGAGAVLMHKPKQNSLYIGNPARLFKY